MGKFIVSADSVTIVNVEKASCIFYGDVKKEIMASFDNNKNVKLLSLDTIKEGRTAIQIVAERMKRDDIIFMPTPEEIKARIVQDSTRYTHLHGEKTKGHGGS